MSKRDPYIMELAKTVSDIFETGKHDPNAEEIARAHFPERALGGEIVEGIRKRLQRIRNVLEQDYDFPVCLLSRKYYTLYRNTPPTTEAEARMCIPVGAGVHTEGLRLNTDENDLIYQVTLARDMSLGAGRVRKSADRTLHAVEDHRMEKPRAATLLRRAQNQAAPENVALAGEVMKELPEEAEA